MPAKTKARKISRRADKQERFRKRVPTGPDGSFQGKHLTGFKGSKAEVPCFCGGCNSKLLEKKS